MCPPGPCTCQGTGWGVGALVGDGVTGKIVGSSVWTAVCVSDRDMVGMLFWQSCWNNGWRSGLNVGWWSGLNVGGRKDWNVGWRSGRYVGDGVVGMLVR